MTDTTVYRRFLEGDPTAFEEIVSTNRIPLTGFILSIVRNENTAEDIAAEVFAHLFLKKEAFAFRSSLKTYLFAIAKNKAKKWLKKSSRTKPYSEAGENASPEDIFFQDEKKKLLYRCLTRIKEEYRQVLYLLYWEECSYEEISKILIKSKKQIANLAFRGKQALKKEMEREGFEYAG